MDRQDKLSNMQVLVLISSTIMEVGVLSLPRFATERALVDGGLATFLAGMTAVVLTLLLTLLSYRFPQNTIVEFSGQLIGRIPAFFFVLIIIGYTIIVSGAILRVFADSLKILLLGNTPLEIIMVTMLVVVIYLIQNGINSIAKICETFLPLIIAALGLVILLNYQNVRPIELRPMLSKGILSVLKGLPGLFMSFLGFEIVLFLLPFVKEVKPKKTIAFTTLGTTIPTIIYTSLVFVAIGVYGVSTTIRLTYPTVSLAKNIRFPGDFAERFDIFFMIFWILAAFTSLAVYYYLSVLATARLFRLRNYRPFIFILLPAIYLLGILPQNLIQIERLSQISSYMGIVVIGISLLLFLIALIRRKGGNHTSA
jgi:spore germination protein